MGLIIEWTRAFDKKEEAMTWAGYRTITFVPQNRYCGARARLVLDEAVRDDLLRTPGYRKYDGPIVEVIPEDAKEVDWERVVTEWVSVVPDSVILALKKQWGVEIIASGKEGVDVPVLPGEDDEVSIPAPSKRGRPKRK